MNRILKAIAIVLLPLFAVAKPGFVIKGKMRGVISGTAGIVEHKHEGDEESDHEEENYAAPVRIINGEFIYEGELAHPEIVEFKISTRRYSLLLENAEYIIEGHLDSINGDSFKGSDLNAQYWKFLSSGKDEFKFLIANPNLEIAPILALRYANDLAKAQKVYELLNDTARQTHAGKQIAKRIEEFKKSNAGAVLPKFNLADPGGKTFTIQEMKGKVVVLDFWASWCKPCRIFIPKLREYYNEFKNRGVEFVSISVDTNKDEWKRALADEKMEWLQGLADGGFSDAQGMKKMFHITGIPHFIVVDKKGVIAASLDFYKKEELPAILEKLL